MMISHFEKLGDFGKHYSILQGIKHLSILFKLQKKKLTLWMQLWIKRCQERWAAI